MKNKEKIRKALELAMEYGSTDGSHHKMWVIDQMVRILADDKYDDTIKAFCENENGEIIYDWECGIAP